jgi:hypothetical protein
VQFEFDEDQRLLQQLVRETVANIAERILGLPRQRLWLP